MNKNSILIIAPYKWQGQWVFDDERTGLVREALVCGIDTMLDRATAHIENAKEGFRLLFSAAPFPNYALKLERRHSEAGGVWYWCESLRIQGWLCPQIHRYFETPPPELYAKPEPKA